MSVKQKEARNAFVITLAYHNIELANHILGFDDPVNRLGTLQHQHDITKYGDIVLQRLQIHYDIHLESTAEK